MEQNNMNSIQQQVPGGYSPVPYTTENPTNVGVVTNSAQQIQQPIQQPVQPIQPVQTVTQYSNVNPTYTVQPVQPSQTFVQSQQPEHTVNIQDNIQATNVFTNNTPAQVTQPEVAQPAKTQEGKSIVEKPEPINSDKYIIRLSELKEMVRNACNLAVSIDGMTLTTLIQLMFTPKGLIMKSTDNENILIERNPNITYNQEISIAVKAELFQKLVNKLNVEYIELIPDVTTRIITLIAGESSFRLTEIYDNDSGESVNISNDFYAEGTPGIKFDGNTFKSKINSVKMFTSSPSVYAFLSGVYCSDKIYATDREDMVSVPNVPELTNQSVYLADKYVKAFTAINFVGETYFYSQTDAEGNIKSVTIYDDNKILSGPTHPDIDQYPVETLRRFLDLDLGNEYDVDANDLLNQVDMLSLFISPIQDKDVLDVETLPAENKLLIKSKSGSAKAKITLTPIDATKANLTAQHFGMASTALQNTLKNIDRSKVSISVGNWGEKAQSVIKLKSGDYTLALSMKALD